MASLHPLEIQLEEVNRKLNQAVADFDADTLTSESFTAVIAVTRSERADLEAKLERARNPPTIPAPPGSYITLPQVLPLSSIAFPLSLFLLYILREHVTINSN